MQGSDDMEEEMSAKDESNQDDVLQWVTGAWPGTLAGCPPENSSHDKSESCLEKEDNTLEKHTDTETASEDELVVNDHEYCSENIEEKKKKQRKRGAFNICKEQEDFCQIRSAKLKKINFSEEMCRICSKIFSSQTEANKHVRRSSCFAVKKTSKKKKLIECGKCDQRCTCVFLVKIDH